jgi:hypothetical protein
MIRVEGGIFGTVVSAADIITVLTSGRGGAFMEESLWTM